MRALTVICVACMACACGSSPTAPTASPSGSSQFHNPIVDRVPLPAASLADSGETVSGQQQSDGTFAFMLSAVNVGTGCASAVSGVTEFRDGSQNVIAVLPWSLPAARIVQPGERFGYEVTLPQGGTFSPATKVLPYSSRGTGSYFTAYNWTTVACQ
jgi:hypothetical protein